MGSERVLSRREFIQGSLAAVFGGALLSESGKGIVAADTDSLHGFLESPTQVDVVYGQRMRAMLDFLEVGRPCDVRWVHRANSRAKLDYFFDSPEIKFVELDFRYDDERGLYIGHDKGDRSDADPAFLQRRLAFSEIPKAIKYDCKDDGSVREVIHIVPEAPFMLNAGLFGSESYQMSPQDLVDVASDHPGVIFSIGRNLHKPRYSEEMMKDYIDLVNRNPDQEFTVPVHIQELMSGVAPFEAFLALPHTSLTVFRTQGYEVTQGHVQWLRDHLPDEVRANTFFDL